MSDHFLLTPFFLDDRLPRLDALADDSWQRNAPDLLPMTQPDDPQQRTRQRRMSLIHAGLAQAVAEAVDAGARPVSVAGDCCATLGVVAGLQQAGMQPALLWFDAHGDFNTWETSPSDFLGGMPLAMLVGLGDQTMVEALALVPLSAERVVLADARDLDPGERALVQQSAVQHVPRVGELLTGDLPTSLTSGPLYVHFDVDILHLDDVPAVSYPATGGPRADETKQLFERLAQETDVAAVSVSTWNPSLPDAERSRETVMSLLEVLLG